MNIAAYLKEHRLITDGAMGTYYQKKYKDEQIFVERANTEAPERVKEIHLDYIAAGAKLIRTNTFATNTMFFDTMEEVTENIKAGYQIAEKAVAESGSEVFIAADLGPIYDSGEEAYEDVLAEYKTICDTFFACGARIFLFETLSDFAYVSPLAAYIREKGDTFVIAQFSFDKSGYTKSGISVKRVIELAAGDDAIDAYGFNCGVEAAHLYQLLKDAEFPNEKYLTALPNAGYPVVLRGKTVYSSNERYFVEMQKKIAVLGVDILGGCCGTEPSYIEKLGQALEESPRGKKRIGQIVPEAGEKSSHALEEKFAKKEKVYIYFMEYVRFEDKYTDPYVEKTGNYLLNILLYETVGKVEYKKMASKYAGKKMCITPYRVYSSWNYEILKKIVTQGKSTKEIAEELGIEASNVRKLRQRIRDVTKDSL